MRILLVDDDPLFRQVLHQALRAEGFAVDEAADGQDARFKAMDPAYDLIMLDLKLPKLDGLSVLRDVRAARIVTPVLFVSACAARQTRIHTLEVGADDYLVKPISFDELLAYIRALLRRSAQTFESPVRVSALTLDRLTRQVHWQNAKLNLTALEFAMLEYLMLHADQVISRTRIYEHVWEEQMEVMSNVVDVHIKEIRRKLARAGGEAVIETVRGAGYRLVKSPSRQPASL